MKAVGGGLNSEISKLQEMVAELKADFSSALLELSRIQHSDSCLQQDIEQTRQHCSQQALQLQALVCSLRHELGEAKSQITQLSDLQLQLKQGLEAIHFDRRHIPETSAQQINGESGVNGQWELSTLGPAPRTRLLLHCYLQGVRAGHCHGQDVACFGQVSQSVSLELSSSLTPACGVGTPSGHTPHNPLKAPTRMPPAAAPWPGGVLQSCSHQDRRQQVALALLQSERQYVSSLYQLQTLYKTTPSPLPKTRELCQVFLVNLEQLLQCHLQVRNSLEERISVSGGQWQGLVGDVFVKLTSRECNFSDTYLTYLRMVPLVLSELLESESDKMATQGRLGEKEELELVSLILMPVSRIHSYLSHIQSLFRWTSREHPDHCLLLLSERTLKHFLSRCQALINDTTTQAGQDVGELRSTSGFPTENSTRAGELSPILSCSSSARDSGIQCEEPCSPTCRSELLSELNSAVHSGKAVPCLRSPGWQKSSQGRNLQPLSTVESYKPQSLTSSNTEHTSFSHQGGAERLTHSDTATYSSWTRQPPTCLGKGAGSCKSIMDKASSEGPDPDLNDFADASVFDYSSITSSSPDWTTGEEDGVWGKGDLGVLEDKAEEQVSLRTHSFKPVRASQREASPMCRESGAPYTEGHMFEYSDELPTGGIGPENSKQADPALARAKLSKLHKAARDPGRSSSPRCQQSRVDLRSFQEDAVLKAQGITYRRRDPKCKRSAPHGPPDDCECSRDSEDPCSTV
nr:PREDICTED: rho guanine nucleotide exchange factor 33-like [Lepisosteus oculatus]